MTIDFSDPLHFQPLAKTFCWTLIHSLWQGLIVAMLTGIILFATSKSRPTLRYNLLAGLLLLFVVGNAVTFFIVYQNEVYGLNLSISSRMITSENAFAFTRNDFIAQHLNASLPSRISLFLDAYQMQITMVWLTIFLLKSFHTVAGLAKLHRIRHTSVHAVDGAWNWQVRQLAAKMDIYRRVLLMESGILKVPVLHGFLKPVIIVPIGFLINLPQAHIEAILLHELAHVKRQDYLVNLLQILGGNLYFFNPAFLWLSHLIRLERENCCDQMVIEVTNECDTLVQALVAFQELRLSISSPGLSFIGTSNHLLNRIKRIIFNTNKQLNTMEKFSIISSVIAVAFVAAAYFTPEKTIDTKPTIEVVKKAPVSEIVRPVAVKLQATALTPNTKPVFTEPEILANDSLSNIQTLLADLRNAIDAKNLKKAEQLHSKVYLAVWKEKSEIRSKTLQTRLLADAFEKREDQLAKQEPVIRLQNEIVNTSSEDLEKRNAESDALLKEIEAMAKENRQNRKAQEAEMQENLINDLLAEGVIKTRDNLTYKLHNMFLIVNGVEQSESLHQKLKARYLERSWTEWVYNWDGFTGLRITGVRYNG